MNLSTGLFIYVLLMIAVAIFWFFISKINKSKQKNNIDDFLAKYPNAVKVYIQKNTGFIVHHNLQIYSVNNDIPVVFSDSEGSGFYCKVGANEIEVEYSKTRPGVIYKTVTKSTGAKKIKIETKSNENYFFYFDETTSNFKIDLK